MQLLIQQLVVMVYFISQADSDAGRAAYILGRVNYLRPAKGVSWNDIQGFIDFPSQVGGGDA